MSKIAVNLRAASGVDYRAHVSFAPTVEAQPSSFTSSFVMTLSGKLQKGRYLAHPIVISVEDDDGEILVSEPHFYIHASGPTILEAIEAFRRIFPGYLDVLTSREKTLGPPLREQLDYLRSVIVSE
jgi:hypothetical protein